MANKLLILGYGMTKSSYRLINMYAVNFQNLLVIYIIFVFYRSKLHVESCRCCNSSAFLRKSTTFFLKMAVKITQNKKSYSMTKIYTTKKEEESLLPLKIYSLPTQTSISLLTPITFSPVSLSDFI